MQEKPKLVPIPTPINKEADEIDIRKPFPIEFGGRFYADAAEVERYRRNGTILRR